MACSDVVLFHGHPRCAPYGSQLRTAVDLVFLTGRQGAFRDRRNVVEREDGGRRPRRELDAPLRGEGGDVVLLVAGNVRQILRERGSNGIDFVFGIARATNVGGGGGTYSCIACFSRSTAGNHDMLLPVVT